MVHANAVVNETFSNAFGFSWQLCKKFRGFAVHRKSTYIDIGFLLSRVFLYKGDKTILKRGLHEHKKSTDFCFPTDKENLF
jgi:hypothetical protein